MSYDPNRSDLHIRGTKLSHRVRIRPATAADLPFMRDLERMSTTAAHWSKQQYQQALQTGGSPERLVLVSEGTGVQSGSSLLGFLVARHVAAEWELENIVVAPEARRRGTGMSLLDALLRVARQTDTASVFLEVRESNLTARGLYEKAGFCPAGRRRSYYTNPQEDAVLYRWTSG